MFLFIDSTTETKQEGNSKDSTLNRNNKDACLAESLVAGDNEHCTQVACFHDQLNESLERIKVFNYEVSSAFQTWTGQLQIQILDAVNASCKSQF